VESGSDSTGSSTRPSLNLISSRPIKVLTFFQSRDGPPSSSSAYPEGSREKVAKPDDAGFDMPYEEHDLTAPDGTKLKTYLMLTEEKRVGPDVSLFPRWPISAVASSFPTSPETDLV
jgi:hypothetical protein